MKKIFKKAFLASAICLGTVNVSHAWLGAGDFNISDIPQLYASAIQRIFSSDNVSTMKQLPEKLSESMTLSQGNLLWEEQRMKILVDSIPDADACNVLHRNKAIGAVSGASRAANTIAKKQASKSNTKVSEVAKQIEERKKTVVELGACTQEQIDKNIYQCGASAGGEKPKAKKNEAIVGAFEASVATDNASYESEDGKFYHTNYTIPTNGYIDHKGVKHDKYNGVEIARQNIDVMFGNLPPEIADRDVNGDNKGVEYRAARDEYMKRVQTSKDILMKYVLENAALRGSEINPAIQNAWRSVSPEVYQEMYGKTAVKQEAPSEQEYLQYLVNKNFLASQTAMNAVSGGEIAEKDMLALLLKISMRQAEYIKDNNRLLSVLIAQSLNPITYDQLNQKISHTIGVTGTLSQQK